MSTATDIDAYSLDKPATEKLRATGLVLMVFGAVALVTSIYFTRDSGPSLMKTLPPTGGTLGPIEIARDNTVLHITVSQHIYDDGWSFIEGEVLDADQESLFSFGDELWRESGYDSDGSWTEMDNDYDLKVTIPNKGTHYLAFTAEVEKTDATIGQLLQTGSTTPPSPLDINAADMLVRVETKAGSAVPFFAAGILGLLLGVILHEMATGAIVRGLAKLFEDS